MLLSAAVVIVAGSMERIITHTGTSNIRSTTLAAAPSGKCMLNGGKATKDMATVSPTASFSGVRITPDSCMLCHEDEVAAYRATTHAKSWHNGEACEQCHGDATKHLASGGAAGTIQTMKHRSSNEISATCLNCHQRPGEQAHAQMSEHFRAGVGCTNCHEMHPSAEHKAKMTSEGLSVMLRGKQSELCLSCHTTVNADFNKPTHHRLKEGILDCSNCHNPHGSDQQHQLRADTKTLCVSCHQDKRGPFVYEHNAQSLDGCVSCHETHGSASRNMLKERDPRTLCISCHSREGAAGVPHGRANFSLQTTGDCTRCHAQIHGSNRSEYFIN